MGEFARRTGAHGAVAAVISAGQRWALADFAFHASDPMERDLALTIARDLAPGGALPASMRGIAVLSALADRAILRREPLARGRGAALVGLRVGTIGR